MNKTIDWIKANVFIVVFGVLILAAFVVLPILSSGMNRTVAESLAQRKKSANDLAGLSNTGIDLRDPTPGFQPPEQSTALINPAALRDYREYAERRGEETNRLAEEAEQFNRKNRGVLIAELFPEPPIHKRETLIGEMSVQLLVAYQNLLRRLDAGSPPTFQSMQNDLLRLQRQLVSSMSKSSVSELSMEERRSLQEALSEQRLSIATEAARQVGVYASIDAIDPPSWTLGQQIPTPTELFQWQWDYWFIEDLLSAVAEANAGSDSVLDAPVKRIRSIQMVDEPGGAARDRSDQRRRRPTTPGGGQTGGGPFISGGGAGMGGEPSGGGARPGAPPRGEEAAPGQPFNPSQEIVRNYEISFTGRTTNPLYDVRYARMHLVVETRNIPRLLDAIGRQNFLTIVALDLWPADPYTDLTSGYVYGPNPTSEVVIDVESAWLRSWTKQFMPDELKAELGIVESAAADTSETGTGG